MERRVIYHVKMTSIGGMCQLDLNDRSVSIDERRVVALLGAVAVSTAGVARTMRQYLLLR